MKREKSQSESSIWYHVAQKDQSESWKKICIKNSNNNPQKSPEILVFLPETPPNLSEPIRHLSRKLVVKFGEEKGNITAEARTRNLWRANPTRTPLDYRVSHTTRQEKLIYLSCNRKEARKKMQARTKVYLIELIIELVDTIPRDIPLENRTNFP